MTEDGGAGDHRPACGDDAQRLACGVGFDGGDEAIKVHVHPLLLQKEQCSCYFCDIHYISIVL